MCSNYLLLKCFCPITCVYGQRELAHTFVLTIKFETLYFKNFYSILEAGIDTTSLGLQSWINARGGPERWRTVARGENYNHFDALLLEIGFVPDHLTTPTQMDELCHKSREVDSGQIKLCATPNTCFQCYQQHLRRLRYRRPGSGSALNNLKNRCLPRKWRMFAKNLPK